MFSESNCTCNNKGRVINTTLYAVTSCGALQQLAPCATDNSNTDTGSPRLFVQRSTFIPPHTVRSHRTISRTCRYHVHMNWTTKEVVNRSVSLLLNVDTFKHIHAGSSPHTTSISVQIDTILHTHVLKRRRYPSSPRTRKIDHTKVVSTSINSMFILAVSYNLSSVSLTLSHRFRHRSTPNFLQLPLSIIPTYRARARAIRTMQTSLIHQSIRRSI